jgi:ABC-type transporter Mla subunit MlaD
VDADEAKEEVVAEVVEVYTIPSTISTATVRTTQLQVLLQIKLKDGAPTPPPTRRQSEGVEEGLLPTSDINNLRETSQTSKAQMSLKTAHR